MMMQRIPIKGFDKDERVPIEVVRRQAAMLGSYPTTKALLNSALNYVLILNRQRQIVFASRNFLELIHTKDFKSIIGKKPGEVLNCEHANEADSVCGVTDYCEHCGLAKAILASLAGQTSLQESRITRLIDCHPDAMDLLVHATPFTHHGETFSIVSIADISHQNRRQVLERVFFQDVMNSTGNLAGMVQLLLANAPADLSRNLKQIETSLRDVLEVILEQKDLRSAENSTLDLTLTRFPATDFLQQLQRLYQKHEIAQGKQLQMDASSASILVHTDRTLLKRVMGHLIKNALEACPEEGIVLIGAEHEAASGTIRFWVRNPGAMDQSTTLQVFSRSFSTKGKGRGVGTYSAKLLTEKYLSGEIRFSSAQASGTEFSVVIPLERRA